MRASSEPCDVSVGSLGSLEKPCLWIVIPARIGSTRLPRKLLLPLAGKSIIWHVCKAAISFRDMILREHSELFSRVFVLAATDSEVIGSECDSAGVPFVVTADSLVSGTDRVHVALKSFEGGKNAFPPIKKDDLVLNIQGDEPNISLKDLENLILNFTKNYSEMATIVVKSNSFDDYFRASVVKVVKSNNDMALYFSRAPIPWFRDVLGASRDVASSIKDFSSSGSEMNSKSREFYFLRHVGVYLFYWRTLNDFCNLPHHSVADLEKTEGLEQLRALAAGWKILCVDGEHLPSGIDTEEDYIAISKSFSFNRVD